MKTPFERESLVGKAKSPKEETGVYGSLTLSDHEAATLASYSEYHRVCDMRAVVDASAVGLAGIGLTFFLIFTSWCAWHEVVEWAGIKTSYEGQHLVQFAAIVNVIAMTTLALLLILMRFTVGPILTLKWRAVFACLLIMTAITVWEALEAVVDMLIGSEASDRAMFYGIACGVAIVAIGTFELVFKYDVIGHHLLVPQ